MLHKNNWSTIDVYKKINRRNCSNCFRIFKNFQKKEITMNENRIIIILGILGNPLKQSLSPILHNYWINQI